MPASVAYGFHEGSRSEYLAQYVFASWGTAVAIPHQEDHGIDLTCTLMERVGRRYLARFPYTVQVKSNLEPLVFEGEEVEWVVHHPLPLYLCVVNKAQARISVYHTCPRFYAWALGILPPRLEMTPAAPVAGAVGRGTVGAAGSYPVVSLDQPILDFGLDQMLDNDFWGRTRDVFEQWVRVENDNLTQIRAGLLMCRMPHEYRTNEGPLGGWITTWLMHADDEHVVRPNTYLKDCLQVVGSQLYQRGDIRGAARAALLHRHLFRNVHRDTGIFPVTQILNELFGDKHYWFAGVDRLGEIVDAALAGATTAPAAVPETAAAPNPDDAQDQNVTADAPGPASSAPPP
jgi:hypothetical protein